MKATSEAETNAPDSRAGAWKAASVASLVGDDSRDAKGGREKRRARCIEKKTLEARGSAISKRSYAS